MGHEDVHTIAALIADVAKDRAVLMVEHNLKVVADIAHHVTVLQRGEILASGNYAAVSKDERVRTAYMGEPNMNRGQPLLSVRGLNAWYGESHALHGVDLDIWPGETITLLGRNGVGKTTTLRAIMGIIRKRTGTITLDGKDIMRVPLHRIAYAGLGFVPEERGIFATLNVHENLLLPPVVARDGQSAMSLDEIYELFPNLHERRNSPGTKLSGGEQQMLAIARILRTGVKVLLLDEPTEGLAPSSCSASAMCWWN